uniref:Uncharacterized protein n=1 Tax=Rhizophora mucronata TaxID=61149 RepID=A0A2P2QMJ1_RHIMU
MPPTNKTIRNYEFYTKPNNTKRKQHIHCITTATTLLRFALLAIYKFDPQKQ